MSDIGVILVFALIWAKWGNKIFEGYQRFCWMQQDLRKIAESLERTKPTKCADEEVEQ